MNLAQNILVTLCARIILLAIALISSVVLARSLGPEGRGLFALVLLLPELARNLGLLGFEQANAVYAGLEPEKRSSLIWQSVGVAAVAGSLMTGIGISFILFGAPGFPALSQGPLWLYLLALATVPARLVVEYWYAILRGINRIVLLNVVEVTTKIASLVLIVVFVAWLRLNVAGAVWADVVISIATVALIGVLLWLVGAWGKPCWDWPLWRRTLGFALPAYGGSVAAYLNYRVDELIIAAVLSVEQLGFYVLAVGLVERLWILTGAVANVLLPHLTNSRQRDPMLPAIIARHVLLWTALACLIVFVGAETMIGMLFSSAFLPAVAPVRWLLPGILMLSVGKVLVAELLAREKPYYSVWATGLATIVNVVCNIILIPRLGLSGAALASSMSYSLLSFMIVWCYLRETGLSWMMLLPRRSDLLLYASLWHPPVRFGMLVSDKLRGLRLYG